MVPEVLVASPVVVPAVFVASPVAVVESVPDGVVVESPPVGEVVLPDESPVLVVDDPAV